MQRENSGDAFKAESMKKTSTVKAAKEEGKLEWWLY
jgi:hypothetical protein